MNAQTITPYLPLPPEPSLGMEAARRFDEAVFERYPRLNAFARAIVKGEFDDAPASVRNALAQPLQAMSST